MEKDSIKQTEIGIEIDKSLAWKQQNNQVAIRLNKPMLCHLN